MALTTKTRLTVSLLFLLAAFVLFVTLRYLWRQGGASDDLYKPAITAAHVGGIPVMKDQAEPIDAMLNLAT